MRRALIVAGLLAGLVALPAGAQDGSVNLGNVVETLQQLLSQVNAIQTQVDRLSGQIQPLQEGMQTVSALQGQIEPLLSGWPEVQRQLGTLGQLRQGVDQVQGTITDVQQSFGQVQQAVAALQGATGSSAVERELEALRGEAVSLRQMLDDQENRLQSLQAQADFHQPLLWAGLAGVALVLVLQVVALVRGRSTLTA